MLLRSPDVEDKVRCPHCGTARLKLLPKIDRIERMYGNRLLNSIRARRGDSLYHCVFCRLQFYDSRKPVRTSPAVVPHDSGKSAEGHGKKLPNPVSSAPHNPVVSDSGGLPAAAAAKLGAPHNVSEQ